MVTSPRMPVRSMSLALVALLAAGAAGCARPGAGEYPQRTIEVVVPYPAGSGIDTTTRALVDVINDSGTLDEDLQVVNKDGGGGTVGTTEVLTSRPDGYTIGVIPDGPLTLVPQTEEVAYDPEEVTVISEIITSPILFVVPEDSPYESLDDLTAAATADPGSITIGEGPLNYAVPAAQYEQLADVELKHIAFDGDQSTTTALLGGNLDVGVMQLASALPQLTSGTIRAIGVTADGPVDLIPDVPTFGEQGVDIVWDASNLVVAPGGLPDDVERQLSENVAAALESPEFAEAAETLGLLISGADGDEVDELLRAKTEESAPILEDIR